MKISKSLITGVCLISLGILSIAGSASAGKRDTEQVSRTSNWGRGSLGSARNSSDNNQSIGCSMGAYSSGTVFATCHATDSSGTTTFCYTYEPSVVRAVATMSDESEIYLRRDGNDCEIVQIDNFSVNEKKY